MITSFRQVEEKIHSYPVQKIAIAAGTDAETLRAVEMAREKNIAECILVGDERTIRETAEKENTSLAGVEIVNVPDPVKAGLAAVQLVSENKAQIFMKGYIHSDDFLRCVLNKEVGLRTENLLSHIFILEATHLGRLLFITDGAMNIAPSLEDKARIISNAVALAQIFEIDEPKVAAISAVEVVTPGIQSTIDAALLAKMSDRRQFHAGIVEGPLALDNAINPQAARYKKIGGVVAGNADILLMPDIVTGNAVAKTFAHITGGTTAGLIFGAKAPVILPSRSDSRESKLMGMACAVYVAGANAQKRVKIGKVHF